MYAWLEQALADGSSTVITANRRLARDLHAFHAERQLQSGASAWRRPPIYSWNEWMAVLVEAGRPDIELPVTINAHQSRVVWEQCLRADIDDPLINIASLARLCRETWQRLHEWRLPLAECQQHASGQDQRIFARAAGRYDAHLRSRGWIDEATLPDELEKLIAAEQLAVRGTLTLAGFDRLTPQAGALLDAAAGAGAEKRLIAAGDSGRVRLLSSETPDSELRAAGRWARDTLVATPAARLAIVVTDLEQDAVRTARLLREGFVPGWQYAEGRHDEALNVSFGRRLGDYPAIHDALLMLQFLSEDSEAVDIGRLLRSPFFGGGENFGRTRLEMRLRDVPDRRWSKTALLDYLQDKADADECGDGADWLARISAAIERLRLCEARQGAARWAELIDELLQALGWPGSAALGSDDFQLVNRWRDLLNEFARLDLVNDRMTVEEAIARLRSLANETIFQAETTTSVVDVLGVLEAAGMEFDRLWVTGLTASAWPPPGRPQVLISRELQRQYAMPDASPGDTAAFAQQVLERLSSSARDVVFSYPRLVGDAEQLPSALLADSVIEASPADSGWHAATLIGESLTEETDRVPAVRRGGAVAGGAATINRQCSDPFAAFAYGRLGIRWMPPFQGGIPARIRGSLVHDALQRLYADRPTQANIRAWSGSELRRRIAAATDRPFRRHARHADPVLKHLLAIEQERCAALLECVVDVDRDREPFRIESVESDVSVTLSRARFNLRCDRIDRGDDDALIVIDYKTGSKRRFLTSGAPGDLQLVVYACALDASFSGLALFNVDSRGTGLDGAGPAFDSGDDWPQRLDEWKGIVRAAAALIAAGDVRLNIRQNSRDARPLDVLSRYAELRHEA